MKPFWKRLRGSGAKIKAVATDMSQAYQEAVSKNLPKAIIVFDHFHVIKLFNEKLSNLRRQLFHEAEENQQKVLKGIRWLLLKNPENLDPTRNEKRRLDTGLRLNKPLATAYYLKEDLDNCGHNRTRRRRRSSSRTGSVGPRRLESAC